MNKERVLQALDNLKGSLETMDYGKWGVLNVEQRNFMRALCSSWLILDDATNKQMKEIERLKTLWEADKQSWNELMAEKEIEIERLNNIINELEDILKRDIKACNNKFENMFDRNYRRLILEEKLEQLQELKGVNKE